MDNMLASPMDVDYPNNSKSSPTPENPLLNHLMLARILKNLDTLDLVNCSKVNKLWFREGRKILKNRRCYARCDESCCEDLLRLDTFLKRLDPDEIWYNGLYIPFDSRWHWKDSIGTSCLKDYDEVAGCCKPKNIPYKNILQKLALKYLKINWYGDMPLETCPGALLIPKLLLHHGQTLEEIQIVDGPFWLDWLYDPKDLTNGKLRLPKLKVIEGKPLEVGAFSVEKLCKLVRVAPNLEDLLVCVTSKDLRKGLVPPDRYNIIKSLCFECLTNFDIQAYNRFASTEPRLRCLVVKYSFYACMNTDEDSSSDDSDYDDDDLDMDLCWKIFEHLLESSQKSLEMIQLPVRVLATQFDSDWQVFPNVRELSLEIPLKQQTEELYIHEVLRHFDFRTDFPNLTSVTLFDNERERMDDHREENDDFVNSVDHQPMLPLVYSSKIRRLTLRNYVTDFGLAYSASVFAHVTELYLSVSGSSTPIPYGTIWREWPQLEILSVQEGFWGQCVNYDAEFLGISKAEARGLQHVELEDLTNLHIVPTKPGITTTKNLRQVTVNFTKNLTYGWNRNEKFFLSPAACILTVKRMPHLKVKLIFSGFYEGAWALRDYVEIKD